MCILNNLQICQLTLTLPPYPFDEKKLNKCSDHNVYTENKINVIQYTETGARIPIKVTII